MWETLTGHWFSQSLGSLRWSFALSVSDVSSRLRLKLFQSSVSNSPFILSALLRYANFRFHQNETHWNTSTSQTQHIYFAEIYGYWRELGSGMKLFSQLNDSILRVALLENLSYSNSKLISTSFVCVTSGGLPHGLETDTMFGTGPSSSWVHVGGYSCWLVYTFCELLLHGQCDSAL